MLIVKECHETIKHGGVKVTLIELRSRFWIVKGRSFVYKLLHKCVICQRFDGRPYQQPPSLPLPPFRVTEVPPFKGMENHKVWICLYTCCVVRAVHLEMVPNLTAQAFLRCFKRFTARRDFPCKIISDNAKTFKSAKKAILTMLDDPIVHRYFSDVRMECYFNLEKASTGGEVSLREWLSQPKDV